MNYLFINITEKKIGFRNIEFILFFDAKFRATGNGLLFVVVVPA
jgi:hypothetical protein